MPQNKEYIKKDSIINFFAERLNIPKDVVEVRYGRVIVHEGREDEYYEYCSECKTMDIHSGDNFCPNCGCKLVGVKHSKHKE